MPRSTPSIPIPERNWVNIQWLARLRWAQIAGQAATVMVAQFLLDGALPIAILLAVVGVGLVSNLALEMYFFGEGRSLRPGREVTQTRSVHEWQLALVMMLDVGILTGLLYLTGGPHNPFGFLYVVQIALATVLLRARWAWIMTALSFVGFGILLAAHQPLEVPADDRAIGAWVALGVASAFVVHFLLRITGALGMREAELTQARGLAARQERLASLATMAAGAAHELSTPLGTVALAAKELERALVKVESPELAADARLIREQVGRCRTILEQMAQGAGTVGESVADATVGELVEETLVGIRPAPTVHKDLTAELARTRVRLPRRAVSQALRSLVTNAQDASPPNAAVLVLVRREGEQRSEPRLAITIRDRGAGISPDVLARIGEPFFTTKAPGRGMGLGLFLARAVVEGVGGTLHIDSQDGEGTEVRVLLPVTIAAEPVSAKETAPIARSDEPVAPAVVSKPA